VATFVKKLNKFTTDPFVDGRLVKFIMERGKHEVLSMFGYRKKLG